MNTNFTRIRIVVIKIISIFRFFSTPASGDRFGLLSPDIILLGKGQYAYSISLDVIYNSRILGMSTKYCRFMEYIIIVRFSRHFEWVECGCYLITINEEFSSVIHESVLC